MFEAEYFAAMTTLNERRQVTRGLSTYCSIAIEANFIDGFEISWTVIDIA
jgi:hypothetical protein